MKGMKGVLFVAAMVAGLSTVASAQGKEQYEANCKKCHGAAGVPAKMMQTKFPKLTAFNAEFFAKKNDEELVKAILEGTSTDMKSYKDKISADDAKAIVAYIKEFAKQQ